MSQINNYITITNSLSIFENMQSNIQKVDFKHLKKIQKDMYSIGINVQNTPQT